MGGFTIKKIVDFEAIKNLFLEFLVIIFMSLILTYVSNLFFDSTIPTNAYQFIIVFLMFFLIIISLIDSYYTSKTKNELINTIKNINSIRYISTTNIKQDPTILTYEELTKLVHGAKKYIFAIGRPPGYITGNEKIMKKRNKIIKKYYDMIENKVEDGIVYRRIVTMDSPIDMNADYEDTFKTNLADHFRNIKKIKTTIYKKDNVECRFVVAINCPTFLIIDGERMLYGIRHLKGIRHIEDKQCDVLDIMLQNGIVFDDFNRSIIPDFEAGFELLFNSSEDIFKTLEFS